MTLADWLVVSVTAHYVVIGWLYCVQNGQPLFLGLYGSYVGLSHPHECPKGGQPAEPDPDGETGRAE
jgi:hypothetical protein